MHSSEIIDRDFSKYPYPVIINLYQALNTDSDQQSMIMAKLFDSFEGIMKFLSGIYISWYQSMELRHPSIDAQISKLKRPSLGEFISLIRNVQNVAVKIDPDFLSDFNKVYKSKTEESVIEHLRIISSVAGLDFVGRKIKFSDVLDFLCNYRNRIKGHGGALDVGKIIEFNNSYSEVIIYILKQLEFLIEFQLLTVQDSIQTQNQTEYRCNDWTGLMPKVIRLKEFNEKYIAGHVLVQSRNDEAPYCLSLFPYWNIFTDKNNSQELCVLNHMTNSKIEYLSLSSGSNVSISSKNVEFGSIVSILKSGTEEKIPDHLLKKLEVSDFAREAFHRAVAALDIGEDFAAVDRLKQALKDSPGYKEAVITLSELYIRQDSHLEAHEILDSYIEFLESIGIKSVGLEALILDAKMLFALSMFEGADERLREILAIDPENPEAIRLNEEFKADKEKSESAYNETGNDKSEFMLIGEAIFQVFSGKQKRYKRVNLIFTLFLVFTNSLIFLFNKDLLMALTIFSLGATWLTAQWAVRRIRYLLLNSRSNFGSFLRLGRGKEMDMVFNDMLAPIFCKKIIGENIFRRFKSFFSQNKIRIILLLSTSTAASLWLTVITKLSTDNLTAKILYGILGFFLFFDFLYLITVLFQFQSLLGKLKFQRIYFSIVQHPKLSIRYLSGLSRRISYPMLIVYVLFSFTLYLGPFLANIVFVMLFSLLVILSSYIYYSTILLVRNVLIQNKWRIISRFSVHFDTPFEDLVSSARKEDMERINELIEMRNFLDSMDVWAEKKSVLLMNSLLYLFIIFIATIGLSNIMTRNVVPVISKMTYQTAASGYSGAIPFSDDPDSLSIQIKDVDDSFIVFWGNEISDLLGSTAYFGELNSHYFGNEFGYQRCDWYNGAHGAFIKEMDPGDEKQLLLIAYNKVYHGFLGLGGGKLSYDVTVTLNNELIHSRKVFIRTNTQDMEYVILISIKRDPEGFIYTVSDMEEIENISDISQFVLEVNGMMKTESDSKVSF